MTPKRIWPSKRKRQQPRELRSTMVHQVLHEQCFMRRQAKEPGTQAWSVHWRCRRPICNCITCRTCYDPSGGGTV